MASVKLGIGLLERPLQPGDVRAQTLAHGRMRALTRRFFSAVSISTSCRRRAQEGGQRLGLLHPAGAAACGRMTSAKCASIWASNASVLASLPGGLGKVADLARD